MRKGQMPPYQLGSDKDKLMLPMQNVQNWNNTNRTAMI